MNFASNLRYIRRKQKCSQNELADFLGYKSFTTIQKWEDGTNLPSYRTIQKVAEFFQVDAESLLNEDLSKLPSCEVPILGIVRGGMPITADQNILGFEHVYPDDAKHSDCFYLEVVGDSMKNARILPGDLLYIQKQNFINNGEIGVVLLDNSEATVKRVFYRNDELILQPENEDYEPIVLSKADQQERNVQIIGKVLHNRIKF